jgi:glycosidase
MFQGDELGMANAGPAGPAGPAQDRNGRDGFRMPMRWDECEQAGFTTGQPWLTTAEEPVPNVTEQEGDPGSTLSLVRAAIAQRGGLGGEGEVVPSAPGTVVVALDESVLAVNLGAEPAPAPPIGRVELEAHSGDGADLSVLPPHAG